MGASHVKQHPRSGATAAGEAPPADDQRSAGTSNPTVPRLHPRLKRLHICRGVAIQIQSGDQPAHPYDTRIGMQPTVPELLEVDDRDVERRWDELQGGDPVTGPPDGKRHDADQFG